MSEDAPQAAPGSQGGNEAGDEAATTPVVPETPAPVAETPAPPVAPAAPAAPAAADAAEAPTVAGYAAPAAAPVDPTVAAPFAAPVAAPVAAQPAAHQNGFFIPRWVGYVAAAIVGILIVGGIGYAIGHESSSSNSGNASANFPGNGNFPGIGNRNGNGNGNGTQNGNGVPAFPGNGNSNGSNGNGNSNGSGNGGTTTSGGFLGVAIQDPASGSGAEITSVQSGSPAADAGLKAGDVVTKVDSTDIATAAALGQAIRSHSSGDTVTVTYVRDGTTTTAKVTLGSASTSQSN